MDFVDMLDMHIHHIEVRVDPMNEPGKHPLNADGMDLRGKNILVEDVVIESGDDGISIKPTNSLGHQQNCSVVGVCFDEVGYEPYTNCSQDMVIRNAWIINSYGIAIGSIPPDPAVNCIKNITFENISEYYPLRGFYIKTNPGFEGSGIVDGITVSKSIRASVRPSIRSTARPSARSFVSSIVCLFVRLFVRQFIRSNVCSSVRPSIHSFVSVRRTSVRSFVCSFIRTSVRCPSIRPKRTD
uniref:Uncharacterized protein n=1 Tax=Acrobeloides nanus TaxID=290746 RepID=A0A914EIH7_9BILA